MQSKIWRLMSLSFVVLFILSGIIATPMVQAASLVTTIATHNTPVGVTYDPRTNEIFVSNYGSNDIQVISDRSNAQVADITDLPSDPYYMAYDSGKNEIWVAAASMAYAISDATDQVVANVTTNAPQSWGTLTHAAYDPTSGEVFVAYTDFTETSTPYIQVISDSSNTVIANITQSVAGIVDDTGKSELFATQYQGSLISNGNVYVISAKTNTITTTIPMGGIPGSYLAYDSAKGEVFVLTSVYISGGYSAVLEVISDATNKIIATISLPTSFNPGPMAYNPNKGEIYVNGGTDNGTQVAIISDKTNSVVGTLNVAGIPFPTQFDLAIAYDSGTSTVYAISNTGSAGSLAVISDASSGTSTSGSTTSASTGTSASASTFLSSSSSLSSATAPTTSSLSTATHSASSSSSSSSTSLPLSYVAVVGVVAVVVLGAFLLTVRRRTQ